jgi:hypothetical protein
VSNSGHSKRSSQSNTRTQVPRAIPRGPASSWSPTTAQAPESHGGADLLCLDEHPYAQVLLPAFSLGPEVDVPAYRLAGYRSLSICFSLTIAWLGRMASSKVADGIVWMGEGQLRGGEVYTAGRASVATLTGRWRRCRSTAEELVTNTRALSGGTVVPSHIREEEQGHTVTGALVPQSSDLLRRNARTRGGRQAGPICR